MRIGVIIVVKVLGNKWLILNRPQQSRMEIV